MGKNMRKRFIQKKVFIIFACVTLFVLTAMGCGSSADSSSESSDMRAESPANTVNAGRPNRAGMKSVAAEDAAMTEQAVESEAFEVEEVADTGGDAAQQEAEAVADTSRKLITTMEMSAETDNFDEASTQIEAKVGELGGYIESSDIYNGSSYGDDRSRENRRANYVIRIPADKLKEFVDGIGEAYNITSRLTNVEDVTLQYVDLESKKKALLTEEESLLKILESAQTVEDIITVQDRLSQVRYQLENMESQLRTFDNQIDYSTVNLSLEEVAKYTPVEEKGAFARMGEGFVESLKSVGNAIKEFIVWFVIHIPQLLFLAIFVAVIWISVKKYREMKKAKPVVDAEKKTEGKDGK